MEDSHTIRFYKIYRDRFWLGRLIYLGASARFKTPTKYHWRKMIIPAKYSDK